MLLLKEYCTDQIYISLQKSSHSLDSCIIEKAGAMHRYPFTCVLYSEVNQK